MKDYLSVLKRLPYGCIFLMALGWCLDAAGNSPSIESQTLRLWLMVFLFGTAACCYRYSELLFTRVFPRYTVSAICLASSVLFFLPDKSAPLETTGVVLTTLVQVYVMLYSLWVISRLEFRRVVTSLLVWQVFNSALIAISSLFPIDLIRIAAPLYLFVFFVTLHAPVESPSETSANASNGFHENIEQTPIRLIVIATVIVMTWYALHDIAGVLGGPPYRLGAFLAAIIVLVALSLGGKIIQIRILYDAALLCLGFALFLASLDRGDICLFFISLFSDAAYSCFEVFYFSIICNICLRRHANVVFLFGVAFSLECIGGLVGTLLPPWLSLQNISNSSILMASLLLLVSVFSCFSTSRDYHTAWGTATSNGYRMNLINYYNSLPGRCSAVTSQFGLSRREEDVLLLLAQAKSLPDIAQELVIALDTVKSHTKSIYRKTGVHSKAELLELIGYPEAKE